MSKMWCVLAVAICTAVIALTDGREVSRQRLRKMDIGLVDNDGQFEVPEERVKRAVRKKKDWKAAVRRGIKKGYKGYMKYRKFGNYAGQGLNLVANMFPKLKASPWLNRIGGGLRAASGDPFGLFDMAPEIWNRQDFFPRMPGAPPPSPFNPYPQQAFQYGYSPYRSPYYQGDPMSRGFGNVMQGIGQLGGGQGVGRGFGNVMQGIGQLGGGLGAGRGFSNVMQGIGQIGGRLGGLFGRRRSNKRRGRLFGRRHRNKKP